MKKILILTITLLVVMTMMFLTSCSTTKEETTTEESMTETETTVEVEEVKRTSINIVGFLKKGPESSLLQFGDVYHQMAVIDDGKVKPIGQYVEDNAGSFYIAMTDMYITIGNDKLQVGIELDKDVYLEYTSLMYESQNKSEDNDVTYSNSFDVLKYLDFNLYNFENLESIEFLLKSSFNLALQDKDIERAETILSRIYTLYNN